MITGFEVGSVFRVIDEATGPLRKILASVRELNKAIADARASLAGFSGAAAPGLAAAISETNALAAAWDRVAIASAAATRSAAASTRGAAAAAVGGGGGFRPGISGGGGLGGAHITGPGVGLPGGSHARLGGTPMAVSAGLAAYGIYEAANMEDAVWQLLYHSGKKNTPENKDRFRKVIEEGMKATGYDLKEVAGAAISDTRMMQGTPGGGLETLPEMLKIAAIEARLKGTSLKESMTAIIGFAHMFKAYTPEAIKALAPVIAFLSTANPTSLPAMERAAGYAVPILQSSMGIDPVTTALLSTALTRAGITSTKAGTWIRELGTRGLPTGKDEHDDALKRLGLVDAQGKATWFTDGKPDMEKAIDIASKAAASIPVEERPSVMRNAFGTQGAGALAVLGDTKVNEQIKALRKDMESEEFKARYGTALEEYGKNSPVQQARTTLQEFNVAMIDLGEKALPLATGALKGFSAALGWFTGGHQTKEDKTFTPSLPERFHNLMPWSGASPLPQKQSWDGGPMRAQPMNFLQGPPTTPKATQTNFSLNIDGHVLAQTVVEKMEDIVEHATSSPNYNGQSHFGRADGGISGT